MVTATLILLSLLVPLLTALGIALAGRWPNMREGVTLTGALLLALVVYSLLPPVLAGERPEFTLLDMMPGISLAFRVEPLGMMFAGVAAFLWP
nr:monovalent cation/H+ antiporter subunit D family protein [Thiolinea sp.]